MALLTNVISIITSFIIFVCSIPFGALHVAKTPENPAKYDKTIMFVSDFQSDTQDYSGADREDSFQGILNAASAERPGLVVGGGDYQSSFIGSLGTAFGISLLKKNVENTWDYEMQYLFCQGNHDAPKSVAINDTGLYEFKNYLVYLLDEDDYPWNEQNDIVGISEKKVKKSAEAIDKTLSELAENGETRPLFFVTHLPLHYSSRSSSKDNRYAGYIYDAISKSADKLTIVYLYGHNHSNTYDDYIGGAINYMNEGDTIHIGGTNEAKKINFIYTNCGYIGFSDNTDSSTSTSMLTSTFITVKSKGLDIKKYSKNGVCFESYVSYAATLAS